MATVARYIQWKWQLRLDNENNILKKVHAVVLAKYVAIDS